jgi:hypothetical protein
MKSFLILILSVLFLTSCGDSQPTQTFQEVETIDPQQEMERQKDSMINATLLEVQGNLKDSIEIIKCQTSVPSASVGGVDCKLVWKNKFNKTIKYIDFYVSAINEVNDEVYSELSRFNGPEKLSLTGPIKPNQIHGNSGSYETVWYNSDIKKCTLRKVKIEFMDGSKLEIKM